jgi:hypothetical protein
MLATVLLGRLGHGVMQMLSHAGEGLPGRLGCSVIQMLSHASDNAVESCWRRRCRGHLVATCHALKLVNLGKF